MCGIAGIFHVDGKPVSTTLIKSMTDSLGHRGPDGEGFWISSFIGFGHRRLAIIDLSPQGHQPMHSDDGRLVITYNGEVYNYKELRIELEKKGYSFRSQSDTEVVLKAYEEWGETCVGRFNGMFAFAIWDGRENKVFMARDRYGIKPLYYHFSEGRLVFASEIKAILKHPDISVKVCVPALNEYFSFQNVFTDLTLFDGIRTLPPAHQLSVSLGNANSFRIKQYWDYWFYDDERLDPEESLREVSRLFEQAVTRQLVSDVEIGSYLSGGIDSGSITCIASSRFPNIKTFTCGFDLSSASGLELAFDERHKAEFLSNQYKTEHYEVVLKAGDMERVMENLMWHLEDPRVGQCYPNYYVARLAGKFVKVVLTGAGGDELFAGYPWRYYRSADAKDAESFVNSYYNYWQRLIPDTLKKKFYHPSLAPGIEAHPTKEVFKKVLNGKAYKVSRPEEYVNASLYFEIKTFLTGLLTVEDKLSMAHGLETRTPFLDNDLVDFAMRIPVRYNLSDLGEVKRINENVPGKTAKYFLKTSDGKNLLRQALNPYVPQDYAKGAKQGFSAPDASWFKGESIDYIRDLLFSKKARIYDYIQPATAQKLMNEHFSGKTNRRLLIWSLLCFEWWNRIFDPIG